MEDNNLINQTDAPGMDGWPSLDNCDMTDLCNWICSNADSLGLAADNNGEGTLTLMDEQATGNSAFDMFPELDMFEPSPTGLNVEQFRNVDNEAFQELLALSYESNPGNHNPTGTEKNALIPPSNNQADVSRGLQNCDLTVTANQSDNVPQNWASTEMPPTSTKPAEIAFPGKRPYLDIEDNIAGHKDSTKRSCLAHRNINIDDGNSETSEVDVVGLDEKPQPDYMKDLNPKAVLNQTNDILSEAMKELSGAVGMPPEFEQFNNHHSASDGFFDDSEDWFKSGLDSIFANNSEPNKDRSSQELSTSKSPSLESSASKNNPITMPPNTAFGGTGFDYSDISMLDLTDLDYEFPNSDNKNMQEKPFNTSGLNSFAEDMLNITQSSVSSGLTDVIGDSSIENAFLDDVDGLGKLLDLLNEPDFSASTDSAGASACKCSEAQSKVSEYEPEDQSKKSEDQLEVQSETSEYQLQDQYKASECQLQIQSKTLAYESQVQSKPSKYQPVCTRSTEGKAMPKAICENPKDDFDPKNIHRKYISKVQFCDIPKPGQGTVRVCTVDNGKILPPENIHLQLNDMPQNAVSKKISKKKVRSSSPEAHNTEPNYVPILPKYPVLLGLDSIERICRESNASVSFVDNAQNTAKNLPATDPDQEYSPATDPDQEYYMVLLMKTNGKNTLVLHPVKTLPLQSNVLGTDLSRQKKSGKGKKKSEINKQAKQKSSSNNKPSTSQQSQPHQETSLMLLLRQNAHKQIQVVAENDANEAFLKALQEECERCLRKIQDSSLIFAKLNPPQTCAPSGASLRSGVQTVSSKAIPTKPVPKTVQSRPPRRKIQSQPSNFVVQSRPSSQMLQSQPTNFLVQSGPSSQMLQSQPPNFILQSQPCNFLVQSGPSSQMLQSQPSNYVVQSQPCNFVVQSGPPSRLLQNQASNFVVQSGPSHQMLQIQPSNFVVQSGPSRQMLQSQPSNFVVQSGPSRQMLQIQPSNFVVQSGPSRQMLQSQPPNFVVQSQPSRRKVPSQPSSVTVKKQSPSLLADSDKSTSFNGNNNLVNQPVAVKVISCVRVSACTNEHGEVLFKPVAADSENPQVVE